MADVQGLGHVGAAVIDDHGLGSRLCGQAEFLRRAHGFQIGGQKRRRHLQIKKAGGGGLHGGKQGAFLQLFRHVAGNGHGRLVITLGGGQAAVALIFAQIGAVGHRHLAVGGVISGLFKGGSNLGGDLIQDFLHLQFTFPL